MFLYCGNGLVRCHETVSAANASRTSPVTLRLLALHTNCKNNQCDRCGVLVRDGLVVAVLHQH